MKYQNRSIEARIREALAVMPAVFLYGPRQAGKSTLVRHVAETGTGAGYVTFDDISTLALSTEDPEGFIRRLAKPVIIDEVQMVPEIFRVLKQQIDERRADGNADANGQFLMTGSANIMALPGLSDALVGRMAVLSLYPLAASEVLGSGKPVINGWFDQEIFFKTKNRAKRELASLDDIIHRATFPGIAGAAKNATATWFDGYLTALLQRDVRQLAEIEKTATLPNMVRVLAARAGGLLNDAECARDAKLNAMTYRRYRILIQQLFLIVLVPPWYRNIGKRLVKSPKLYFTDTALLCHQLGVSIAGLPGQNPTLFGNVLENFVASELTKQLSMISDGTLHHFRSHDNREVDFVIERRDGRLLAIEVKAREIVRPEDFTGLKMLRAQVGRDFIRGIVLYLGKDALPFGDDMAAMPLESLWDFDMEVRPNKDIKYSEDLRSYIFWANYGGDTEVRCRIARETIRDHFHDHASKEQGIAAIRKHWDEIWPAVSRKITDGQIERLAGVHQIRQVTLEPRDFGAADFRKR